MEVKHQRIKEFGEKSKIRTIIREEAVKLGQFLRRERSSPGIQNISAEALL